ncbi:MAG TPA: glycosyltransferase [Pyrinomonadaceae bacterium]|jgi:glycosyltransferase involved in cell wall biosynthesis
MTYVVLASAVLLVAGALLCLALWNALAWPRIGDAGGAVGTSPCPISVLIPARDEEDNIAACLDSALAQGASVAEVLVYDDHSRDGTARVVESYARRDPRVRLVAPSPLPAGWCGKTFACARLAGEARAGWLLFLDADARLEGGAAALIAGEAESRGVTLLSCWPRLETRGFWEGALMPMLNFVVFTLYPAPLALRRMDASLGLAHGSCVLARRDDYERVGGHAAVRAELFEDVRLAQAWRAAGRPSLCLDGRAVVGVRMYRSPGEIWRGFQKNFFPAFRSARSFWSFMALHLLVFLLPFALAPLAVGGPAAWPLAAAAGCVLLTRAALAWRFGHPWWSVAAHPLAEAALLALGLSSWLRCRTGCGVEWKGRSYLRAAPSAPPIQTEGVKE